MTHAHAGRDKLREGFDGSDVCLHSLAGLGDGEGVVVVKQYGSSFAHTVILARIVYPAAPPPAALHELCTLIDSTAFQSHSLIIRLASPEHGDK